MGGSTPDLSSFSCLSGTVVCLPNTFMWHKMIHCNRTRTFASSHIAAAVSASIFLVGNNKPSLHATSAKQSLYWKPKYCNSHLAATSSLSSLDATKIILLAHFVLFAFFLNQARLPAVQIPCQTGACCVLFTTVLRCCGTVLYLSPPLLLYVRSIGIISIRGERGLFCFLAMHTKRPSISLEKFFGYK